MQIAAYKRRIELLREKFSSTMSKCLMHNKHCCPGITCMKHSTELMTLAFEQWPEPEVAYDGETATFRYYDGNGIVTCSHGAAKQCHLSLGLDHPNWEGLGPVTKALNALRAPYIPRAGERPVGVVSTAFRHLKGIAKGVHEMRENSLAKRVVLHIVKRVAKEAIDNLRFYGLRMFDPDLDLDWGRCPSASVVQSTEIMPNVVDENGLDGDADRMHVLSNTIRTSSAADCFGDPRPEYDSDDDVQMAERLEELDKKDPNARLTEELDLWPGIDGETKIN